MRTANHREVVDAQKMILPFLASKSSPKNYGVDFHPDAIFGNEKLLTLKLMKEVVAAQKNCMSAVLLEQARQIEAGEDDPDAIAHASHQFSRAAVARARAIGLLQAGDSVSSMKLQLTRILKR